MRFPLQVSSYEISQVSTGDSLCSAKLTMRRDVARLYTV
jgi:hypothetical protein